MTPHKETLPAPSRHPFGQLLIDTANRPGTSCGPVGLSQQVSGLSSDGRLRLEGLMRVFPTKDFLMEGAPSFIAHIYDSSDFATICSEAASPADVEYQRMKIQRTGIDLERIPLHVSGDHKAQQLGIILSESPQPQNTVIIGDDKVTKLKEYHDEVIRLRMEGIITPEQQVHLIWLRQDPKNASLPTDSELLEFQYGLVHCPTLESLDHLLYPHGGNPDHSTRNLILDFDRFLFDPSAYVGAVGEEFAGRYPHELPPLTSLAA
jgi:hypothetical protein